MRAGELRERVLIQSATASRDSFGAEVLTWADTATVWAKVVERGGREPVVADRPVMIVSYEVTLRSSVTVTHKHRLLWRGKTLAVDTVTPKSAEGLLVLRCLETES